MPFERPRIEVFQEFKNVVVSPAAQEFSICLVGPCYDIYDYVNDKSKLSIGAFVKSGQTKDAPCDANGVSNGRPDAGQPFATLSEPPQFRAGAKLDSKSVYLYFDKALIDLVHGDQAAYSDSSGLPVVTITSTADFSQVKPGDRLVINSNSGAVVKTIKSVVKTAANTAEVTLTSFITESITGQKPWRIEHQLSDVELSQDVLAISDNSITINVPSTGMLAAYEGNTYVVNYAEMYLEYRALRTDLQKLIQLNTIDDISSTLGLLDERNPLAVGAYTALSNAGTPIYVYGVNADSLTGHTAARDFLSSNKEIYAIVPLSDSLDTSDWLSVLNMWKQDCENQALPEKSRFRVVLGSMSELPTYKNSVDPSITGSTLSANNAPTDVFVTSMNSPAFTPEANFENALLDVNIISGGWGTIAATKNIFDKSYSGAKVVKGVIGSRRLRVTSALNGTVANTQTSDYFVRYPVLASEGGATILQNVENVTASASGGVLKLTHAAFNGVVRDHDIVQIVDKGDATVLETAYYVSSVNGNEITTSASFSGSGTTVKVNVYRIQSIASVTKSGDKGLVGTLPSGYGVGDAIILLEKNANGPVGSDNIGMYRIGNVVGNQITLDTAKTLIGTDGTAYSAAVIHVINADGAASMTARPRLTLLRDDSAQFLSTVAVGEYIEIPYPANQPGLTFDTTKNRWPIAEVITDQLLRAQLGDLEELAPKNLVAGFAGDCPYRIAIGLDKANQVKELKSIISAYKSMRLVMCWPHAVKVSGVYNKKNNTQNYLRGQYLACAVGGQIAANPPQQGFTFLPISAITKLDGSSFYFTDDQLTDLRNGGWYVFIQDTEESPPYSIHEVTSDVSAYEFGELMHVKDFDYVSIQLKNVLESFKGRYNITPNTIEIIKSSLMAQVEYLKNRRLSRLGPPLLDATLGLVTQSEADRLEIYMELQLPHVLNRIGLHLAV